MQFEFWWFLISFAVDFRGALECAERATNRRTLNYFSIYLFVFCLQSQESGTNHMPTTKKTGSLLLRALYIFLSDYNRPAE